MHLIRYRRIFYSSNIVWNNSNWDWSVTPNFNKSRFYRKYTFRDQLRAKKNIKFVHCTSVYTYTKKNYKWSVWIKLNLKLASFLKMKVSVYFTLGRVKEKWGFCINGEVLLTIHFIQMKEEKRNMSLTVE